MSWLAPAIDPPQRQSLSVGYRLREKMFNKRCIVANQGDVIYIEAAEKADLAAIAWQVAGRPAK